MRRALIGALAACTSVAAAAATATAAPVSVGISGWQWGSPSPQGETLTRVAFQGARGYAVGAGGTVLRSDDGGNSWVGLASGTRSDLSLLQEVAPGAVVVGGQCTVRESTDAGASFHRLPVNESEQHCANRVASFSFLSVSTGYVEQGDGSILFTTDGGQSLQPKTSVPLAGGTAVQLEFLSPSVGFAIVNGGEGGRIYRTTNGAGSWTQVGTAPAGEPLRALTFASPTVAYAVGGGSERSGGNSSVLLVSEDAGATWSERPLGLKPGNPAIGLSQVSCRDPQHCAFTFTIGSSQGANAIVSTADGGATAKVAVLDSELLSLSYTSGPDVIAVGIGGTTAISPHDGESFSKLSGALSGEYSAPIRVGASPQDAYLPGHAGRIAASSDGGASWGLLQVPTSADLLDSAFPSPQVGYAVNTAGTIYRTGNGGQSWSILGSAGQAPTRLLALSNGTVLLVGPTGLRRSTDAGASFTPAAGSVAIGRRRGRVLRRKLAAFPLFAGAQTAGAALIAWGDDAIESTDGGANWRLLPRPLANGGVEAVSFLSASTGYEVSRQRLFFTRSGGRSWSEIASLGTGALGGEAKLSFSNAADGYVLGTFAGRRNVALHTENGGRTWSPELLPREVEAISGGGSVDYAIGEGALFATTTGGRSASSSSLALAISGPHALSRARLRHAHGAVRLTGRLSPAQGGETVVVSYRTRGRAVWRHRAVTVASNGSFAVTIAAVAASTDFVAQWAGEGPVSGAGTAAQGLTVTRR
jgi:photosystem II stability/assembly factor-like uncharacterized protein